jgi:hypothetical protein
LWKSCAEVRIYCYVPGAIQPWQKIINGILQIKAIGSSKIPLDIGESRKDLPLYHAPSLEFAMTK